MKGFFKFLLFVSLSFALVINTFAIDAPANLEIESSTDTSVVVMWEPVDEALMYYVYYGTESGQISDYDNYSDFVEGNSVEIDELNEGTNYYFAVTSLDENGEESVYSDEIVYNPVSNIETEEVDETEEADTTEGDIETDETNEDLEFIFDGVSVISYDKLKLSFTNPLNDSEDAIREFKITNKVDSFDAFEVISTELDDEDKSIVEVMLDRDLEIGAEYEVVVVAITSEDGKNIESGIDNIEEFIVNEIEEVVEEEVDLNAAGTENTEVIEDTEEDTNEEAELGLAGTNIDASEIENTTLAAAAAQEELPTTGPEHVVLLIISIILGTFIFLFKFKRS